jgi:hypothetical protein
VTFSGLRGSSQPASHLQGRWNGPEFLVEQAWQSVEFRKHLMKYVVLDKPVVCIPWASDPHWTGWSRSTDTEEMVNREWHQFQTCMEFDVSCAVFAVAGNER